MAVYTHISNDDIIPFLRQYNIGDFVSLSGISDGVENTNYILKTTMGKYILTLFEQISLDDLPFYLSLMDYLDRQNMTCPKPIANNEGRFRRDLAGKPTTIFSFLEGAPVLNTDITPNECSKLGAILATLHQSAEKFPEQKENNRSLNSWVSLFKQCQKDIPNLDKDLEQLLKQELSFLKSNWSKLSELPRGLIHADLFPDNVLFDKNGQANVIDFYFACTDFLAYDLAICLNAWCFDGLNFTYNKDKGQAFFSAYQNIRPLTDGEKCAFPILLRGASMRFLLSRLHREETAPKDALALQKDPDEYIQKLKFHQSNTRPYF